MLNRFAITAFALLIGSNLALAAEVIPSDKLRTAAAKALEQIQNSQATAIRKENCASCHHQLLPEMPLSMAAARGVKYDPKRAHEATLQTFGFLTQFDIVAQGVMYIDVMFDSELLTAAHDAGIKPNLSTDAEAHFVAGRQLPDGSWRLMDTRPPQSKSRFTCTANCARAIAEYLPESMKEEKAARLAKAREWLMKNAPKNTEERVAQLCGLLWTGADVAERQKVAEALLKEQRSDGGWSQLPGRDSDAYSTGSALSALKVAADLATSDAVYQRGLAYLLKSQQDDGTWCVNTRLNPPAPISPPFASTGFPHGRHQFSSMFGTTWAVTAILHALPVTIGEITRDDFRELAPDVKDEWVRVALNGTAEDLKRRLDAGMDPNSKTTGGTTALMLAARDAAKVKLLVDRGADANRRAKSGFDALMVASRFHGNAEVVKMLLKAGAKPDGAPAQFDASPAFFAASSGDVSIAAALLDAGAKPNERMKMLGKIPATPVQYAVTTGDAAMVEFLLSRGGDVNEAGADDQISLLGWAAISNQAGVIDVLLKRGAKVDHKDTFEMTPLLYAASIDYGDTVVIEKLLAAGADMGASRGGKTALDLAKGYKHTAIAEKLAKKAGSE